MDDKKQELIEKLEELGAEVVEKGNLTKIYVWWKNKKSTTPS